MKQAKELTQRLEEQQKAVAGEITELKDATTTANSKIYRRVERRDRCEDRRHWREGRRRLHAELSWKRPVRS